VPRAGRRALTAISSAATTSSERMWLFMLQPTIRRLKRSCTAARQPALPGADLLDVRAPHAVRGVGPEVTGDAPAQGLHGRCGGVEPGIEATNWRAEQAIRPAVVNRKSWGGNRTSHGAEIQQTLMSVIRTSRQHDVCPIALLEDLLRQRTPVPSSMLRRSATTADPRGP